jgi:3-methyladenine DNA glycosylase AlkD
MTQLTTVSDYVLSLEKSMLEKRNETEAPKMKRYMKDHFPYLGVKSPIRKEVQSAWIKNLKGSHINRWDIVYLLWEKDAREYQYIAMDYLNRMPKKYYQKEDHKMLEELLTTKSWWDSVDTLASNCVGTYFQLFPEQIEPIITRWRNSNNMWLNRTCLIFQLKYKNDVDFELLKGLIRQYKDVKEFFIQKAIGWSLRQYSKFNPDVVRAFVDDIKLEGLARREALKYL